MNRKALGALLAAGLAAAAYLAFRPAGEAAAGRAPAPPLSGPLLGGGSVSLSSLSGKVVLVDFWATWCGPCREAVPELSRLHRELSPRGFLVLAASVDDDLETVERFAKARGISYPVLFLGPEPSLEGWWVPGLPAAYLVGRDGRVIKRWFGARSADALRADIEAALAAPEPGAAPPR